MEIINLDKERNKHSNIAIALGNFDGIHLGHQELIRQVVIKSKTNNLKPAILLFNNHTKSIINKSKPSMLTTNNQKYKILNSLGIELIFTMDFTKEVMDLSQEKFIKEILSEGLKAKEVVVGFDYRFGRKAEGNSNSLKSIGKEFDISVEIVKPIEIDGKVVSSSYIRELISKGNLSKANKLLGRNYSIEGKVISGASRGTGLGFPTANLGYDKDYLLPVLGVYKTKTKYRERKYLSMTDIGYNPTFEEDHIKLETFILDFDKNIYGETIEVEFIEFLREGIKFNNKEDLIIQLEKDEETVRNS